MKKINLIRNPELFQGEKYLKSGKKINYFEGYYFKNISSDFNISLIPGISINDGIREAFIQIITNKESWYIKYDIDSFEYNNDPFWIRIGNNYFSKDKVHLDIYEKELDLKIYGSLEYSNGLVLTKKILSPNIMGIFSYIPFMECNHAILNMKNNINGFINLNGSEIIFNNGIGYIEKDYGYSFPKRYIWGEGNCFSKEDVSFMFSIADIPFKIFSFKGFICNLNIANKEYRFASYNFSKIINYEIDVNRINILFKRGKYILEIECDSNNGLMLKAPVNGSMEKNIYESIDATIKITLKNRNKVIYSGISKNCGLEVVK